jgi:hypothetical protein
MADFTCPENKASIPMKRLELDDYVAFVEAEPERVHPQGWWSRLAQGHAGAALAVAKRASA